MRYWCPKTYELQETICINSGLNPITPLSVAGYIALYTNGVLKIRAGYAWNGADVIPDDDGNMLASLIHDALYQLMRVAYTDNGNRPMAGIVRRTFRKQADILFRDLYIQNGGRVLWVWVCYLVLRIVGWLFTRAGHWAKYRPPKARTCESPKEGSISC